MEGKNYYYEEDLSILRVDADDTKKKIESMQIFIKYGDYNKLNKTQQHFFDKQLDSLTQYKYWLDARIEHVRLARTMNRR